MKYARSLFRRNVRSRERAFLVEGIRLFLDAVAAGAVPIEVFVEEQRLGSHLPAVLAAAEASGAPIHPVTQDVLDLLTETEEPQGVVAVFPFPSITRESTSSRPLFLVADAVADPGNLGTLIRSALGAGVTGFYVSPGTVDPFSAKVVRSAMGAHFRLPIASLDWHEPPDMVVSCEKRVAADADSPATYLELDWCVSACLIIGNEARGISSAAEPWITDRVSIPLAGGLESLNAAVAGSVILFEAARQRRSNL